MQPFSHLKLSHYIAAVSIKEWTLSNDAADAFHREGVIEYIFSLSYCRVFCFFAAVRINGM